MSMSPPTADNRPEDLRIPLVLPLPQSGALPQAGRDVLIVLHAYHVDIARDIIRRLASLRLEEPEVRLKLVITTDTGKKVPKIEKAVAAAGLTAPRGCIVDVHPNRGRNVAPFLAACRQHAGDGDLILHLHTKRSPHAPELAAWGEYLFDCLAGSRDVFDSIMGILADPAVGLIYPAHYRGILRLIAWGPNFEQTRRLLETAGVSITAAAPLDFPSGMMFWTRLAALQPLLDTGLGHADFDLEAGQTDGTLAHAVERAMNFIVAASNHTIRRVIWRERTSDYWG